MISERRQRKRSALRKSILVAAFGLFSEAGLDVPTVEDITEAADIGKGTFYLYFPSRDALIAELVREGIQNLIDALTAAVPEVPEANRTPRAILEAHGRFFQENPSVFVLFQQARGWLQLPSHADASIRQEFTRYLSFLEGLVGATPAGRSMPALQSKHISRTMAGYIWGALSFDNIMGQGLPSGSDLAARLRTLADLLEAVP